jgi:hypothetical protein
MSLVERLKQLPTSEVEHRPPASDEEIDEIEEVTGFKLPADLRELLVWSNGVSIRSSKTGLSMFDAYDLAYTASEPHFDEDLPGMLILGSDNGGAVFYADPNNQIGRGAWAVYLVRMSEAGIPHSMFVGKSFTEAIETLLAQTDIYKRPELGESAPL